MKIQPEEIEYSQTTLFPSSHMGINTFLSFAKWLEFVPGPGWPDKFGASLRKWSAALSSPVPVKTLSLFSGGGGLDIGFHDAGFDVQAMVEIDGRFTETLVANSGDGHLFGKTAVNCIDIREYTPPSGMKVDLIIGGPPCQTFSAAGRRAAGVQGTNDKRGSLFEEYVRLLKHLSPRGFLFENVYGITGAQSGEAWEQIKNAFEEAGYRVFYRILDAADYGVPQHRERLFIVGTKGDDYFFPRPTHGPDSPGRQLYFSAKEAIEGVELYDEERNAGLGGRYGHLLNDIPPGLNYSFYTEKLGHPQPLFAWRSKFSDFLYKADPNSPVRTLKAQGGQYTGPFHWENRRFTVGELKRLQTIPDDYMIVGGSQAAIHQIGNSVPPQIARILALSMLQQIFKIDAPVDLPLLEDHETLGFRKRKHLRTTHYKSKADEAISALGHNGESASVEKREYTAKLSNEFHWGEAQVGKKSGRLLHVKFIPSPSEWLFRVTDNPEIYAIEFLIEIQPAEGMDWGLGTQKVTLEGGKIDREIFTSLWKAFEAELVRHGKKADIVQLNGYYQYKPILACQMHFMGKHHLDHEWTAVKRVVNSRGVAKILSTEELAEVWNIPKQQITKCCLFLKRLGYEVRNSNTNPQIPKGHFLIPYAFPTLTPLSVQLRKHLEEPK